MMLQWGQKRETSMDHLVRNSDAYAMGNLTFV